MCCRNCVRLIVFYSFRVRAFCLIVLLVCVCCVLCVCCYCGYCGVFLICVWFCVVFGLCSRTSSLSSRIVASFLARAFCC